MVIRYLSSAGIGIVVTTTLLWTMNSLIEMAEPAHTAKPPRILLPWVRILEDTPVETNVKPPERVAAPAEPPQHTPPRNHNGETIPVGIPTTPTTPDGPKYVPGTLGNVDSGLINIINAKPDYPVAASQKGLEGYVVVQFDVTEIGTVENVAVLESSSAVFNKAAVRAAYRSRYKPKTVDGVSQRTQGLRKLFRFEMDN